MGNASDKYIMQGASSGSAGKRGVVPQPSAGDQNKLLKGDGTWSFIGDDNIDSGLTTAAIATSSKTGNATKLVTAGTNITEGELAAFDSSGNIYASGFTAASFDEGKFTYIDEDSLSSDMTTTSTSSTDSGLGVSLVIIGNYSLPRYIEGLLDWNVNDSDGLRATGNIELQRSDGAGGWNTLATYTKDFQADTYKKLVGYSHTDQDVQVTVTSTSLTKPSNGCQVDYTAVSASNHRRINYSFLLQWSRATNNGQGVAVLQYSSDGTTWSDLESCTIGIAAGGSTTVRVDQRVAGSYLHTVSDATPYYRVALRVTNGTSSDAITIFTGSYIRVEEWGTSDIKGNREPFYFSYRDTGTITSFSYRVAHKVTSGDSSTLYSGSKMWVKGYNES